MVTESASCATIARPLGVSLEPREMTWLGLGLGLLGLGLGLG